MPDRLQTRRLHEADLPDCAELLAARHRADRTRLPMLEPAYANGAAAEAAVRETWNATGEGAVALCGGRVVGYCMARRLFIPETEMAALFVPPRAVAIPPFGHAVAGDEDATAVYRALYACLAEEWVRDGLLVHRVEIAAGDRAVEEAWLSLGFGRVMTAATRPTARPVEGRAATVEIVRATPADLETVVGLSQELAAHHRRAPMFWPNPAEAQGAMRRFLQGALASEIPTFVARDGRQAIGMQSFLVPGFTPESLPVSQRLYLFEGVVSERARAAGVGTALLRASMAWAREAGYDLCTLHWASGNFSGAPFWLGHGFVPVQHTMERRVDERALWGRALPGHTA